MARQDNAHTSRRRWPAVVSVAALIAISLVAGASAQLDVETVDTRGDTVVTPVAKETSAWVRYAGAEFGTDTVPASSVTDVGTQFYGVAFENEAHGFAGGMRCKTAPPADLRGAELSAWLETCGEPDDQPGSNREPVIYEYVKEETGEERWFPVLPPTGTGYVASIAFMPGGRALAVGGTGRYPKREPSPSTAANDPAGDARAWLYANGFWTELAEPDMAPGMRGLTSVAMAQVPNSCNGELSHCGLAGGYRQLWIWKDGKFRTGWGTTGEGADEQALSGTIDDLESFRFRVRQIAFNPNQPYFTKAFAVTSGCCDAVPSRNVASGLVFDGEKLYAKEFGAPANNNNADPVPGDDPVVRRDTPDSLYSLVIPGNRVRKVSVVATPGGPPPTVGGDRPSRVYGDIGLPNSAAAIFEPSRTDTAELTGQAVSTMRLNGAAGWRIGIDVPGQNPHRLDWAVGSLGSGEGIAYFAQDDRGPVAAGVNVKVLTCGSGPWPDLETNPPPDLQCQPYDAPGYLDQTASKTLFRLPTYGLNAIAFTDSDESVAWAVGDRGALVRFGGVTTGGTAAGGETAPKLGSGSTARFPGSEVYDSFRPLPVVGEPAPVPSLAANGSREVERPELVSAGAPNPAVPAGYPSEDVTSVVMSRDGSEGWAIGSGGNRFTAGSRAGTSVTTIYHFDGLRWSRCDISGVPGLVPADPACAGLAALRDGGGRLIPLRFATRVPLENDKDPSNDHEFEVVALAAPPANRLVRYRRGEWFIDKENSDKLAAVELTDYTSIAFTSPDDGWITTRDRGDAGVDIVHWNGTSWVNCRATPADCGDGGSLLPVENGKEGRFTAVGRRIYLSATRFQGSTQGGVAPQYPVILYKDPGGQWTAEKGGHDPLCPACTPDPVRQGQIFSVVVSSDFKRGWAIGLLGTDVAQNAVHGVTPDSTPGAARGERYYLLRLSGGQWRPYRLDDASADYLSRGSRHPRAYTPVFLDQETGAAALYALDEGNSSNGPGFLIFDPSRGTPDPESGERGRWRVLQTPFHNRAGSEAPSGALPRAFVPDERGGAWLFAKQTTTFGGEQEAVHVWHYTRDVPNEVFDEAPHPIRERITGGAAGQDGSFWVTTNSSFIYRYDRLTGWDRLRVPGWDPGRVVTRASTANAVAVGPDGEGLVVGETGRLAQISPLGVQLDPAAGRLCGDPPCGTGRDLRAVDVAPDDGSALAGGDAGALLWRPAGEPFRAISLGVANPPTITGISMPASDRAWLTTSAGQVYEGTRSGAGWNWAIENRNAAGKLLSLDEQDAALRLTAIDIDGDGEGYAVGERGLILERHADGTWERLKTRFMDTLRSVTLSPQGRGGGALVGGDMGLVLTLEDGEFRVSREADLFDPVNFGTGPRNSASVRAVAMVPGLKDGEVEAWAVQQVTEQAEGRPGPGTVLHYSSDGDDPLMRPGGRVEPLPDAPEPREGEITFAAFGRSDCNGSGVKCPEGHAGNLFHEVITRRITDEVIARSDEPGGPGFAIFTGDVGRAGGLEEASGGFAANSSLDKSWVHKRWKELVAERFAESGVPLFGAVGLNDLDRTAFCTSAGTCPVNSKEQAAGAGLAFGWRKAMADLNWGTEPHNSDSGLVFTPVEDPGAVEGAETSQTVADEAHTHYALDVTRGNQKIARIIVLDNSMRALNASDPGQNPFEPDGQLAWLDRMLATRAEGQQAIAVMNTPTYSYQAGDPSTWATDAAEIERRLLAAEAEMLVSGRLGWNGRFWATAPGVHHPCPEGAYIHDNDAPDPSKRPCEDETAAANDVATRVRNRVADAMQDLGAPAPPGEDDIQEITTVTDETSGLVQGLLPQVVAASAGGPFGPNGTEGGPAGSGWWHGYTLVRMDKEGNPDATIVEQRPIFDWISITAPTHVLKPRQRITLIGEGREPVGADVPPRYDRINSHAITHRYDLVMADEKNPSVPRRDENGNYVPVPTSVGEIDSETGVVKAGAGRQERTFTVAVLSVGDKAASWPIAFEPAKSFKPAPRPVVEASVVRTPPRPPQARPVPPPPVVLNSPPAPTPPPTPPANIPQVTLPTLKLPSPPAFPNIPSLPAGTPTPTPPPPAAPPPPPGDAGALPLSLEAPLTPVSIVTTVIPPSPPPVNPAPPSGSAARKEARQRQAATAKSEEGGGDQGASEGQSAGESGSSSEMTRRDRSRPAPSYDSYRRDDTRYSFTAVSHGEQASAWSRGALYGGMTIATALVLALGWGIARPTPRRRHPPRPAPETVRERPRQ